ncbi:dipicolinic acid synthetase subunit A [Oceanobacillus iheyensis]|nr:dipicolinic acid synthetase subunit A [Oceanobacillus iheyensis]
MDKTKEGEQLLNGTKILIAGGDARYIEVIDMLTEHNAQLYLAGFSQLNINKQGVTKVNDLHQHIENMDAIVLPVAGIDDEGKVEAPYSDKPVKITDVFLKKTPDHCRIYSGTARHQLKEMAKSANRKLTTLFSRDDLAIYNSIPTGEGALKLAIENTKETVHGATITVLGFGRVGVTVARLFSAVGANVTVAVRKKAAFARLYELGIAAIDMSDLEQHASMTDIFINTIPAPVLTNSIILKMKQSGLIIDLASSPGGTDFNFAKQQGIHALHALGLPGKTAPKTAGRIIATILQDELLSNHTID